MVYMYMCVYIYIYIMCLKKFIFCSVWNYDNDIA
jgi:hypothetical protein